ncbi:MAG: hypothetical protein Q8761_03080 [Sweet potato little leaf phytoplasma]|nr:hypothetical protein [Sweet potato little leaf phytoplasma]
MVRDEQVNTVSERGNEQDQGARVEVIIPEPQKRRRIKRKAGRIQVIRTDTPSPPSSDSEREKAEREERERKEAEDKEREECFSSSTERFGLGEVGISSENNGSVVVSDSDTNDVSF